MNQEQEQTAKTKPFGVLQFLKLSAGYFKSHWLMVAGILLMVLLQAGFRVAVPVGYSQIFDVAIAQSDRSLLLLILGLLGLGWLIQAAAGLAQDRMGASLGARVINHIRMKMYATLQRLSSAFYARVDSGDLLSRFTNDLTVIENAYVRALHTLLFSALILVASVVTLFVLEWRLALMTFACLPLALVGPRLLGGIAQRKGYDRKKWDAVVSGSVQEAIGTQAVVKAFRLQQSRLDAFSEQLKLLAKEMVSSHTAAALVGRSSSQTLFLVQILIMGIGGFLVIAGHLTLGSLVGFVALLLNVSNAANHIASVVPDLLQASAGMQHIQEFLDREPARQQGPRLKTLPKLSRAIRFQNVSFQYDGQRATLQDVSFEIQAGEQVAVVGPSGCGKSTLLGLLIRFYGPDQGQILLDGMDVDLVSEASLRDQIGVVMQQTQLFNATLASNIGVGNLQAGPEQIVEAAKRAEIHRFITSLEQGYDTQVGEWGGRLSGGQRQRIAIARAILRDPALLLLDEATSALDPATEKNINETLAEFAKNRTMLGATHRLAAVTSADRILVMDDGRLVEQGQHDQLLKQNGLYYQMWSKQGGFKVSEDGTSARVTADRLKFIPLLNKLGPNRLNQIAGLMDSHSYPAGRMVFAKGDRADHFYIIARGTVEVILGEDSHQGREVRWLQDGDFFGEMALLDNVPRNATVKAGTDTLLLSLGRRAFRELLADEPAMRQELEREARKRRVAQSENGAYSDEEDAAMGGGIQFKI